jgi:hypothetical protein
MSARHARRKIVRPTLVVALYALLAAASVATAAPKSPVIIDKAWTRPDFASVAPARIAVFPAVVLDNYPSSHPVSDSFYAAVRSDRGRAWIPPMVVWAALGSTEAQRLAVYRPIATQIRNEGHTDRATTERLAQLLKVDALMLLRVGRWEQVSDANQLTAVEAHGEMVDAHGEPLWKITGRSRVFGKTMRSEVVLPAAPEGTKITQTVTAASAQGSGSNSSSTSTGAATGGASTGTGSAQQNQRQYGAKIEQKVTPTEEYLRTRGPSELERETPGFPTATRTLIAALKEKLPVAPARADSTTSVARP